MGSNQPAPISSGQISEYFGWSQPAVTSNTSHGIISASSFAENCEAYRALDAVTSLESNGWATDNSQEGWWKWELPQSLRFKRIIFVNRNSETNDPEIVSQQCQFYAGDKTTKMGSPFIVSKSREYVTIDCGNLESNILYFYKLGGRYSGIGELIIEASVLTPSTQVVAISRDLKNIYSNGKSISQLYSAGKLIWTNPNTVGYTAFISPKMLDNFSYGCLNASNSAGDCFKLFDTDNVNSYVSTEAGPQWLLWILPHEILVKEITFKNAYSAEGNRSKTVQFFADEERTIPITEEFLAINADGGVSEITALNVKTDKIYCYIKDSYGSNDLAGIGEIQIRGRTKQHAEFLEDLLFSKTDLDFEEDVEVSINSVADSNNPEIKLFDGNDLEICWTSEEISSWDPLENSIFPTIDFYFKNEKQLVNGITITNGDSAVTLFDWQVSNDAVEYKSLGLIQTPIFSHIPNSECNIAIPHDKTSYRYHRFIIRGLANDAKVVSMKELKLNTYKSGFQAVNFSYPFTDLTGIDLKNPFNWFIDSSTCAYTNNDIGNNGSTSLEFTITTEHAKLLYQIGVSSESNYDWAVFSLDGVELQKISGTKTVESSVELSAGSHTIVCTYYKDGSSSVSSDCMYLYYLKTEKI